MQTINDHEFLQSSKGDLALILDVIAFDEADDPVLLVSRRELKAYFRRSKGDIHEIVGINPEIINDVRGADFIVVVEMLGGDVTHSYDVPTGIFEDHGGDLVDIS